MQASTGRDAVTAARVRTRLIWLSAQAAGVRNLGYTRCLTAAESEGIAQIEAESAALRRTLAQLGGRLPPRHVPPVTCPVMVTTHRASGA